MSAQVEDQTQLLDKKDGKQTKDDQNMWQWYKSNPCGPGRSSFAVFAICGFLSVVWLILFLTNAIVGFLLAGICCILMSGYGANHFRILLGLREGVDDLARNNKVFKKQNAEMAQELNRLGKAREQLQQVERDLRDSNKKLKENLDKFEKLDETLQEMGAKNLSGLGEIAAKSKKVMGKWQDSLIQNERDIIMKVYDQCEFEDDKPDMSQDEFDIFLSYLPAAYKKHFDSMGLTWDAMSGEDSMLDFAEFGKLVDQWAETVGQAGGSAVHE